MMEHLHGGSVGSGDGLVLVTGVTGFLGSRLVAEILARTSRPVVCLVRGNSQGEAERRGRLAVGSALRRPLDGGEEVRLRWLRGDIQETRLGQNGATWLELIGSVEEIFHCAASVRFDLPLAEAQSINVGGTRNVLELAEAGRTLGPFRRLHHISTAFVAGTASATVSADHLPGDRAGNFRNTYERTKARAERLLRDQTTVPVTIYRPSIVAGTTDAGVTDNWNVLYVPMRMIARSQLPVLPASGRALVDSVGVDYVVRAIVHLSTLPGNGHAAHHLTAGPEAFTVHEFVRTVRRVSRSFGLEPSMTEIVSAATWRRLSATVHVAARAPRRAQGLRRWGRLGVRGIATFQPYAPYTGVSTIFDNETERSVLRKAGIDMPPANHFLETIAAFAVATDFGRSNDLTAPQLEVVPT